MTPCSAIELRRELQRLDGVFDYSEGRKTTLREIKLTKIDMDIEQEWTISEAETITAIAPNENEDPDYVYPILVTHNDVRLNKPVGIPRHYLFQYFYSEQKNITRLAMKIIRKLKADQNINEVF